MPTEYYKPSVIQANEDKLISRAVQIGFTDTDGKHRLNDLSIYSRLYKKSAEEIAETNMKLILNGRADEVLKQEDNPYCLNIVMINKTEDEFGSKFLQNYVKWFNKTFDGQPDTLNTYQTAGNKRKVFKIVHRNVELSSTDLVIRYLYDDSCSQR